MKITYIAERRLFVSDKNDLNKKTAIVIKIGAPYWVLSNIEAACPVVIEGLFEDIEPIRGIDFIDSMKIAIQFIDDLLRGILENNNIEWPSGEPYF
ncbi:hypothetical protein ACFIQF_22375 [Comamonas sp. J-3]|uniref:hypothetical protein n=1 Tax=Comamonas trifloxystrobinivorans TaxID=3350256 RepID=UPI00372A2771